ncbi:hypothetical protein D3C85_1419920 [compost metagenome]
MVGDVHNKLRSIADLDDLPLQTLDHLRELPVAAFNYTHLFNRIDEIILALQRRIRSVSDGSKNSLSIGSDLVHFLRQ